MSLFDDPSTDTTAASAAGTPLAERMRPASFDEFVGQQDSSRRASRCARPSSTIAASIILWGPPGTGKTTLARLIAEGDARTFVSFSAVLAGIKEIKEVMAGAEHRRRDEPAHDRVRRRDPPLQQVPAGRFLPRVEAGDIVLIGATTENPSFEVNAALLSRSKVFAARAQGGEIVAILERALTTASAASARADRVETALAGDRALSNGDARAALNLLELTSAAAPAADGQRHDRLERCSSRAARGAALRQERRRALQHHVRAAQVDAQQRSRRVGVLAGAHARGGEDPLYVARG
jgi:putative ATPase